jgi:methionyl-tRNA formyltransferase
LLAGDQETGVTIMEVVLALDAGATVSRAVLPIGDSDTTQSLHDALSALGADLMVDAIASLEKHGALAATPQDEGLVTYAHKLDKAEAAIDWHQSAAAISRQVRAFNPFPVAQSQLKGEVCRIWMATAEAGQGQPGEIMAVQDGILVACGEGVLRITELQAPGGKRMPAPAFVQGHNLQPGDRFSA